MNETGMADVTTTALFADYSSGMGTGIVRYQNSVLDAMGDWCTSDVTRSGRLTVFRAHNRLGRPPGLPTSLDFARSPLYGKVQRVLNVWARVPIERLVSKLGSAEVVHSFVPERLHTRLPWLVTVYDTAWRGFGPEYRSVFSARMEAEAEYAIRHADWLLPISRTVADELIANGARPNRVVVAAPGVDPKFAASVGDGDAIRRKYDLPERFIAYVGTFFPRKNVSTLITALSGIRPENAPPLVIAGPPPAEGHPHWGIDGTRVRHLGYLDESDLPDFYKAADVIAFPSLLEGFGLPLAEAMAAGTPVVASDIPIFREVGGDSYVRFDPTAADAVVQLRSAIDRLWGDAALRLECAEAGQRRAAGMTWVACRDALFDAYRQAARRGQT